MPATGFTQQQPVEGAPATEKSEVRFLYDDDNLYIGGTFYEDHIDKLVVNELRRDFNPFDGDLIMVGFDTFYDKLNSYELQTNSACALRDIQSYDDGRNINANWDAVWTCKSTIGDKAFFVEESIPFKQLRFPRSDEQVWGLNILRLIRHKYEHSLWSAVPRQYNAAKTSYEGVLEGISDVGPGRNIRVKPFATGGLTRRGGVNDGTADGGVDVKIGLGTNLVRDGTYRTDCSQVEVGQGVGRPVDVNGSLGTDHGTATPTFLFGMRVKTGFYGRAPSLTDRDDGNVKVTTDFRRIYATILKKWLGYDDTDVVLKGRRPGEVWPQGP